MSGPTPGEESLIVVRQRVLNALARGKLVEGLVHKQEMRQHGRVEQLVSRQTRADLAKLLLPLHDAEIGAILSGLGEEDQELLWQLLPAERSESVLLEVESDVREALRLKFPAIAFPHSESIQRVSAFAWVEGQWVQWAIDSPQSLRRHTPVWVDLVGAREAERTWVEERFGLLLPSSGEVTDIESSARFYSDKAGAIHLYSDFLLMAEGLSRSVRVAFLLHQGCLISLRNEEVPVFRLQRMRAGSYAHHLNDGVDILLDLYAADVEYSAGAIESVDAVLEAVSQRVLDTRLTDEAAGQVLAEIGVQEKLNGQIRRNLMDTRRALSYLSRTRLLEGKRTEELADIRRDIDSLDGHTAFLFDKINFLMDATVGFININQNKVIRIFSVASVALLPPTLVASIYGMNFQSMPELNWQFGYPFAISVMLVSVALPLAYFKRRGWLS